MTTFIIIFAIFFVIYKVITNSDKIQKWAKESQERHTAQFMDFMEQHKRNEELRKQRKWNRYHNSPFNNYNQNSHYNAYNNPHKSQNKYNQDYEVKDHYKQKGNRYEYKIKCFYENMGYTVYPQGYIHGYDDRGIDLIAYKDNEVHLIQCKCYSKPPKQELLRIFMGDCELYISNNSNKLFGKNIHRDFVTSCKTKDYGVIKFLENNKNFINYLVIEE